MNAQLSRKIVFWRDTFTGAIKMGLPEEFPAPDYHEKIVCNTAHDAEQWSQVMRNQEAAREQLKDEEREEIEGRLKANLRNHIFHLMANARNELNREFLRRHLESYDNRPDRTRMKRESFLHAEGYERGH